MTHKETKRLVAGAKTAVLCIHGIIGTPNHFAMLTPLVPDSATLYNLLLDGHGKMPLDFGRTCMKVWEKQVDDAVTELAATHDQILIVGHSMGTLFAMEQAIREPKVKALFLIAVPILPRPNFRMLSNAVKIYFDRVRPEDPYGSAASRCYGIGRDRNPLHYRGWILRYLELFRKVRQTRKILPLVSTPCAAYQSQQDEMVSSRSIPYLRKHTRFPIHVLKDSGHTYYAPADLAFLQQEFRDFLKKNAPL